VAARGENGNKLLQMNDYSTADDYGSFLDTGTEITSNATMTSLRTLLEHYSRGRILRRRLPQKFGGCRMLLTPECGLSYWLGIGSSAQKLLQNAVETVRPSSVVWDVGANMGLFTFASAGLAGPEGRVYAFEPDTSLVSLMRRSATLNDHASTSPVEIIPCAISDSVSMARFHIANRSRAANFLEGFGSTQTGGIRETHVVMTMTLDWMAQRLPAPDVLKIDAEGAELDIFRGGERLLKAKRPIIICEVRGSNREPITELLKDMGYQLFDSDLPLEERTPLSVATYNTLCIPEEQFRIAPHPVEAEVGIGDGFSSVPETPARRDSQTVSDPASQWSARTA
jgi:FkbM family methyltransferase